MNVYPTITIDILILFFMLVFSQLPYVSLGFSLIVTSVCPRSYIKYRKCPLANLAILDIFRNFKIAGKRCPRIKFHLTIKDLLNKFIIINHYCPVKVD